MIPMTDLVLKIKYLENYDPLWPKLEWAHPGDAGLDLRACIPEPVVLTPGERLLVPNGVQMELCGSQDVEIQIRARSGLAAKHGIACANGVGTVDCNYRGELKTILINLGQEDFTIAPGDRIAQAVICPIYHPVLECVDDLSETSRAAGGFGSTGRG